MTGDPFAMYDGAYVLGALSDSERHAFEEHLATCDSCAASVRDLGGLPRLLASVPESALLEEVAPPRSLLLGVERRMRRDVNRRRWIMGGIAAAAACLITVAVVVVQPDNGPSGHPVAMSATGTAPITATADIRDVAWGTSIEVTCHYDEVEPPRPYALVVVDRNGTSHELGTWNLSPGKVATYQSGTALHRSEITAVEITTVSGKPLLTLRL